jgi:cell division protein FtsZ
MRGAQGLLISITGGNDLTLYEVDEAATRIREEVDQDANIILGATFDQSLDGIIRVSVVATGLDLSLKKGSVDPSQSDFEGNDVVTIHGRVQGSSRLRMPQRTTEASPMGRINSALAAASPTLTENTPSGSNTTNTQAIKPLSNELSALETSEPPEEKIFLESESALNYGPSRHSTPAHETQPPSSSHHTYTSQHNEFYMNAPQPLGKGFDDHSRASSPLPSPTAVPEMSRMPISPLKLPHPPSAPFIDRGSDYSPHQEVLHPKKTIGNTVAEKRTSLLQRLLAVGFGSRQEEAKAGFYRPQDGSLVPSEQPKAAPPPYMPDPRPQAKENEPFFPSKKQGSNKRAINEEHLEIPAFLRR